MGHRMRLALVAIGGNALITGPTRTSIPDQYQAACVASKHVADLVQAGWNVVLTHGNGPQIGFILRRSELGAKEVPIVPMDYAGADLQGALGYMFVRSLKNEFHRRGVERRLAAVVTQTLVDRDDPAFAAPTKPIGAHMSREAAERLAIEYGWTVREDAGRGWRRVVASPAPKSIVEIEEIRYLTRAGCIVVACGGGGIPVVRNEVGDLLGVEAVIDKDLASSLLARELGADAFIICTSVEKVAIDFNTPSQRWLDRMTVREARRYLAEDRFDGGTMRPKVQALADFVEATAGQGVITSLENLLATVARGAGTRLVME
jgi:carbamate kinase